MPVLGLSIFNTRFPEKQLGGLRGDRAWVAVALSVWALLILGLAVVSYLYPWSHTVYDIYARACRNWWNGQDLYYARGTDFYRYSPLFAISLTPWALLPDQWGTALWRIFSGLFYVAAVWVWARGAVPEAYSRTQQAILLLLVLPLSAHSMHIVQANLVMLGALLFGVTAASAENWTRAACWCAIATLIKGYPLAFALLVAALFPRRFLARYVLALALGLVLPFAAHRPDFVTQQYQSWLTHLHESTVLMRERLRTLEHLFSIYGHSFSPHTFLLVQSLAGLAILGICLLDAKKGAGLRRRLHIAFQLFACWVVLFGPATESCTYIVIAPVVAWTLIEAFRRRIPWTRRVLLICSFLMMGPLTTDIVPPVIRNFANEHGSQPIGALLFTTCLLVEVARSCGLCYAETRGQLATSKNVAA
jgi:hypothetical protein